MNTIKADREEPIIPGERRIWFEEIVRETEHYFQGEIQQDQRASWLLATASVLIAIVANLELTALDKGYKFAQLPMTVALVAFSFSAALSVLTLLPLRGIRFWGDMFGGLYRRNSRIGIAQLLAERFPHGESWSDDSYERRVKYHFRSHYLRSNLKAYGILWASVFLLLGLLFFAVVALSITV